MPNYYRMDKCPSCQQPHNLLAADGVPHWDEKAGVTFEYVCRNTSERVSVYRPAEAPPEVHMTATLCQVCRKANYKIVRQTNPAVGTIVTQYLECSNEGCQTSSTGQVVVGE